MAIIIDDRAREVIMHRRARGHDPTLMLRIAVVPVRGMHRVLSVGWAPRRIRQRDMAVWRVGDAVLYVGERLARYARWRDVTVSAWHVGPIDRLMVVDELPVLREMEAWERAHPVLARRPVA